jgi:hypothetical protein
MRAKLKAIKMGLRKSMHDPIANTGVWVGQMLQGHLNYFAVSGDTRASANAPGSSLEIWCQSGDRALDVVP